MTNRKNIHLSICLTGDDAESPVVLCECGCGKPAPIATETAASRGYVKGQPRRFIVGHNGRKPAPEVRYREEDRGYVTPCWIAEGVTHKGYCQVMFQYKQMRAHRVMYARLKGEIPEGKELDHLCRVRSCVNPDHLEPVTRAVNARRGMQTKITADQARAIRESSLKQTELARIYGIARSTVGCIKQGRRWVAE